MTRIRFLVVLCTLAAVVNSTPTWMWIATYGIDNYAGNGGGGNLSQSIAGANEFAAAADVYCPLAYIYMQKTDAAVRFDSVANNWRREMCDFIYFDGHGTDGLVFLGYGAGYGFVDPDDLDMGTNYNRWAYFYTCLTLAYRSSIFTYWTGAFSGVQTILGFASLTWAVSYKENIHNQFWNDWVNNGKAMGTAHLDACEDWLWNYGGLAVHPALMSSNSAHANSYTQATSAAGGSPSLWMRRICE